MIPYSDGDQATDSYIRRWVSTHGRITLLIVIQAYLEFFVSGELLELLLAEIDSDGLMTYHVINKQGDLRTNSHSEGPNAVTWGVFPGKEIIQPTIVEAISFMAWKVNFFGLMSELIPILTAIRTGRSVRTRCQVGQRVRSWFDVTAAHHGHHEQLLSRQRRS